jgi:[BtrI acyl-carrier protein]--L-glutamate ligase
MITNPLSHWNWHDKKIYWYCNLNHEQTWNESKFFPSVTDTSQLHLILQQEQQMIYLTRANDTVLFRHQPDLDFWLYLQKQGIQLPNIQIISDFHSWYRSEQMDRSAMIVPYMVTEEFLPCLQDGCSVYGSNPALVKFLNNKLAVRKFAQENGFTTTKGYFCGGMEQLIDAYRSLTLQGFEKTVIKIPYGSSGKGLKIIHNEEEFDRFVAFIKRRIHTFTELVIEGWYSIERSLNAQLLIEDGNVHLLAVTEQHIDENAVYMGSDFTPQYNRLLVQKYRNEMLRLGHLLKDMGVQGVLGVDSIVDQAGVLYPIIEINARFTQVTYLLPLIERLNKEHPILMSRFLRFCLIEEFSFNEIYECLNLHLEPDSSNYFLVYTFATNKEGGKTNYRMFVLFYGSDRRKVQSMMNAFLAFNPISVKN